MSALVFIELEEKKAKKSSLEAVSYAKDLTDDISALVFGNLEASQTDSIGAAGASKILHVSDQKLAVPNIMAYASVLAEVMNTQGYDTLVLAKSSLADPVSARVSIKTGASLVANVGELPSNNFFKTSIYTGKAFANVKLNGNKRIVLLKKNAVEIKTNGPKASISTFCPTLKESDFKVKIISTEKTTGQVLLPEADIVVSAGRGLKAPENWTMIEDLAQLLGAATACSKPVSDMDWRPHHEHVGQTGIKVSPTLYIAIGISGAIQHLAGVNSSKYIVVINKDPEAPFFKAADYGIVGDAFKIIPKLIEILKA